jgi:hypothetical protein
VSLCVALRGSPLALEQALDRLLVGAEVLAVVEGPGQLEVRLRRAPPWLRDLPGVEIRTRPDGPPRTGLEDDGPIRVGEEILVRPPWVPAPEGFRGLELVVPRGGAFGSGEHGSTQAALLCLHALWPAGAPRSLCDVGTGSGVLALYGRVRGIPAIRACDVDPAAVAAARALLPGADVREGGPEVFGAERADVVVANLDAPTLAETLDRVVELWSGRGPLCLSGLREGETPGPLARLPWPSSRRICRDGFVATGYAGGRGA